MALELDNIEQIQQAVDIERKYDYFLSGNIFNCIKI